MRNKRRKPSHAKTSPKANQAIHGSCNQSSLKQFTLYWSLSNNTNSDLENPNSKCRRSDAATSLGTKPEKPLTPFPTRKRLSSSVDDYENLTPKKHHSYLVKNDHYNTKHSGPPNSGQNNTKRIPSSKETKTSDIAPSQASSSLTSVPKEAGLLSKQPIPSSSTDLPLNGMRCDDDNNLSPKKHHQYLVNDHSNTKHSIPNPKHSSPPNSGQNNTKHLPSEETKTSDIGITKLSLREKTLDQASNSLASVPKETGLLSKQPFSPSSTLTGMRRGFYNKRGKLFYKNSKRSHFDICPQVNRSDTKFRRSTIKGNLFEKVTCVNFVSKSLLGVENKSRVRNCRDNLIPNLNKFNNIRVSSQVVRNDMTNKQQAALTETIISKRKINEILHIKPGRGRKLKC